jgi:hypothetical protein
MKTLILAMILSLSPMVAHGQTLPDAPQPTHRFLDWKNTTTLTASAVSLGLDGFTTQEFIGLGDREHNPVARGLGKSRLGTVIYFGGCFAVETASMYFLHRRGWHRLERFVPIAVTGLELWQAQDNRRFSLHLRRDELNGLYN